MFKEDQPVHAICNILNQHIQQLKGLAEQIEQTVNFGNLQIPDKTAEGKLTFPYWEDSEVVSSFRNMAYKIPLLVEFDWVSWQEGRQILQNKIKNTADMDVIQICKLFTIIIRADRFNDGFLIHNFENGNVLNLLRALVDQTEKYEK